MCFFCVIVHAHACSSLRDPVCFKGVDVYCMYAVRQSWLGISQPELLCSSRCVFPRQFRCVTSVCLTYLSAGVYFPEKSAVDWVTSGARRARERYSRARHSCGAVTPRGVCGSTYWGIERLRARSACMPRSPGERGPAKQIAVGCSAARLQSTHTCHSERSGARRGDEWVWVCQDLSKQNGSAISYCDLGTERNRWCHK